eukprot:767878-Hanusia_phi.AAC.9
MSYEYPTHILHEGLWNLTITAVCNHSAQESSWETRKQHCAYYFLNGPKNDMLQRLPMANNLVLCRFLACRSWRETPVNQIEEAFKSFTARDDVAVILITQSAADSIRYLLDDYESMIPTVLEIPSKDNPYDPSKRIMKKMAVGTD